MLLEDNQGFILRNLLKKIWTRCLSVKETTFNARNVTTKQ